MDGLIVVDKPVGPTSADVVARVRRAAERVLRSKRGRVQAGSQITPPAGVPALRGRLKAGHAGTLDPLASGVLVVCIGEATKLAPYLLGEHKTYRTTVRLGEATDTGDAEGRVIARAPDGALARVDDAQVAAVLERFRGEILQLPPMYSAIKQKGRPLYELAREGIEVPREPRKVQIHRLELLARRPDALDLEVDCSAGTYIRTLGADIGEALGVHGHLTALRRLRVGPFRIEEATTLEHIEQRAADGLLEVVPPALALAGLPGLRVGPDRARRVRCGQPLYLGELARELGSVPELPPGGRLRIDDETGQLLAVVRLPGATEGGAGASASMTPRGDRLVIERVFNLSTPPRAPGSV